MKRVLAFLVALLAVAACGLGEALRNPGDPVAMTPSTLAGTWDGGTQRFITFREDGTFSAINLPAPPFQDFLNSIGFDPATRRLDGSGTWTLATAGRQSAGPRALVHLAFGELAGARASFDGPDLSALRPGDGKVYLVLSYGSDEGNSTTGYLKCASGCVPPSPVVRESPST